MRLRESQNTTPYRNREQVVGQNKGAVAAVITAVFHTNPLLPGRTYVDNAMENSYNGSRLK